MNALIGYSGFIGTNLLPYINNVDLYRSTNIEDIKNKSYDIIYCCGINAKKWYANLYPKEDIESINKLINILTTVKCNTFVLISTIDVLDCTIEQNELTEQYYSSHSYGKNRLYFEEWCNQHYNNCYIFRLPALFGHGLKKNALFDLINNNNIDKLRNHWVFQWYNLNNLYNDIQYYVINNIKLVHLLSEPIELKEIIDLCFNDITIDNKKDVIVNYKISSAYKIYNKQEIINDIKLYIKNYNKNNLVVSELGWDNNYNNIYNTYLENIGIKYIELVPPKYNWNYEYVKQIYNREIYSIQSLLFNKDIQVFQQQELFISYIKEILIFCKNVNAKVLVFGSPKQRIYSGEYIDNLFIQIGELCKEYDILFCIEHNSKSYGCNWMTTFKDVYNFVKKINHPNIKINLDIGNLIMENEILNNNIDINYIGHVQISFPYLEDYNNNYDNIIIDTINIIKSKNYKYKYSLEVLKTKNNFNNIIEFINILR